MNTATRRLKIYYGFRPHSFAPIPVIRLAGIYLRNMGFRIGDSIEVFISQEEIRIRKIEPAKENSPKST